MSEQDDDVLVEVARQLCQQLHAWQDETIYLSLAEVREMLEAALAQARATIIQAGTAG